ncbi:MAG TPA: aspartate aminotransferase family protein [Alphaproteobacteria bacterium]|nr:aspartate aminotransferase family protein [Alphaproteobacteria bacterium]
MSHVFHRLPKETLPVAVMGEGAYIVDRDGKRYLDASGGAAVSCLGHNDREVVDAIKAQLDRLPYAHSSFFTTEALETLADTMIADAPAGLDRVYFVSGGSEAVEAAIKLARQYFVEVGQLQRRYVVARRQSYHGNTLGALAAGGNMWRREQYKPLLFEAHHIAPCYAYRDRRDEESEEQYGSRVADDLEQTIQMLGVDTVMCFVAEPVVGATLGSVPAVPGYFKRVREICDRHGVLLILDEVMCGMGRTGTLYASEQEGITPDITCVAKGLGAGYQPIGAMLASKTIYDAILAGTGFFQHGHTYMGHPAAAAAALAVQRAIKSRDLLARVRELGQGLEARLNDRFGNHAHVGDIRGRGLFRSLEFVADRTSKAPFDPTLKLNVRVKRAAMNHGLMSYAMGGTIDGKRGDHVMLAPPYILEDAQLDEIVDKLGRAVDDALQEVR